MKKIFILLLSVIGIAGSAAAEVVEYFRCDGICYHVTNPEEKTVEVSFNLGVNQPSLYGEYVNIPGTVTYKGVTYEVTGIGDEAFLGASDLVVVRIADSVKEIGVRAFEGCTSLTGITLPSGLNRIGSGAFSGSSVLNVSFTSEKCPELPSDGIFDHPEKIRVVIPSEGYASYETGLSGILDGKYKLTFGNTKPEDTDGLMFRLSSPFSLNPDEILKCQNVDWNIVAGSLCMDLNSRIYMPQGEAASILMPISWGDRMISITFNGEEIEPYYVNCKEESKLYSFGMEYFLTGVKSHCWVVNDVNEDISAECRSINMIYVNQIETGSSQQPEYFNLQGMPVANPEKGELVIEKRDGKTIKKIYR